MPSARAQAQPLDAGIAAFNAGRIKTALALFERRLAQAPDDRSARLMRAHALAAAGRLDEARRDVEELSRRDPRDAGLRLQLADLLRRGGRAREAAAAALDAVARDPALWTASAAQGSFGAVLSAGTVRDADHLARGCAAVLRRAPAADGYLLLARLQKALGRERSSALLLARAAAAARAPEERFKAAEALKAEGRLSEAAACLAPASRLLGRDASAAALLADCLAADPQRALPHALRAARLRPDGAEDLLRVARLLAGAQRHAEAVVWLRGAAMRRGAGPAARLELVAALARAGRGREAVREAARLKDGPQRRAALREAASCSRRLGRHAEALAALEALGRSAWTARDLADMAALAATLGPAGRARREAAVEALTTLAKSRPSDAEARRALGRILLEDGRAQPAASNPAAALAALESAARRTGWTPEDRLRAARLLTALDRPDEALRHCAAARAAGADAAQERRARFAAASARGARSEALAAALEGRRLWTRDGAEALWATEAFEDLCRYELALEAARAAVRAPGFPAAAGSRLARLEAWHGRYARARSLARAARRRNPANAEAWVAEGAAETKLGRPRAAVAALRRAVNAEPTRRAACVWQAEALRVAGKPGRAERLLLALIEREPAAANSAAVLANLLLARLALGRGGADDPAWAQIFDLVSWQQVLPPYAIARVMPWPSREALEALLDGMRGNRSARQTFARMDGGRGIIAQSRVETLHLQASLRFGDPDLVVREFERLIAEDPKALYSWSALGETCLWLGRVEQARRALTRARRLSDVSPWPFIGLGACALLEDDLETASHWLARAPSTRHAAVWRGHLLRRQGRPEEAVLELAKAGARFPYRLGLWLELGAAQAEAGRKAEAAGTLRLLRAHAPELMAEGTAAARGSSPREIFTSALALMRGNRSTWMYTYFGADGKLRHQKLRGIPEKLVPENFRGSRWMFYRGSSR